RARGAVSIRGDGAERGGGGVFEEGGAGSAGVGGFCVLVGVWICGGAAGESVAVARPDGWRNGAGAGGIADLSGGGGVDGDHDSVFYSRAPGISGWVCAGAVSDVNFDQRAAGASVV